MSQESYKVGIIVAAHAHLAKELLEAAQDIINIHPGVAAVTFRKRDRRGDFEQRIEDTIKAVDNGYGVLILTDMYGDSSTKASLRLNSRYQIQIVTGVSLPMLIEAIINSRKMDLDELAEYIKNCGKDFVLNAAQYQQTRKYLAENG